MFKILLNRRRRPVLGDSGCTQTCMSLDYFNNNPYLKQFFTPMNSSGKAINGTDVNAVGEVCLKFLLGDQPMSITCKVIKGLMDPVILGWDWCCKYGVNLDAANGQVTFCKGKSVPLLRDDRWLAGKFYRVSEDLILPPNSTVHANVELTMQGHELGETTAKYVITEPFSENNGSYWAARTCSNIRDNFFMTEFINCSDRSVKIPAGEMLGHAQLVDDKFLEANAFRTEMFCSYRHDSQTDELDPPSPTTDYQQSTDERHPRQEPQSPDTPFTMAYADQPGPPEDRSSSPSVSRDEDIPEGAKPLHIDFTKLAEDARPYEPQLRELLLNKRKKAFSRHDRDYGKTHLIQYRAHMKDREQNPLAQRPYRTRPEMREVIDKQAFQMIADGLVAPSKSPYAAPIMLAKKKCGGWRFLTDFRRVNECCDKVVFPLPRITDSIQRLDAPKFFSSMDLTKGFWQIPIHPDDRKFYAFSTESMHLEYLVAPMGAKNSPSYLSSLMQLVLRGLPIQNVISYLDDILVADSNMEDHLKHLDQVLFALEKAGLKLNPSKSLFARDSVTCLGHKLSREGVAADPANIEKIKSWKPPTTVKQLRGFLGLTGYYRQFVRGYSDIARCLTDLTKDDVKWVWEKEHQKAFETLRDALISDKVMCYPDFSKKFIIKTDASLSAIGYVLSQRVDGKERVIAYGSKKLSPAQVRWSTYDREYFALVSAVRANAHYLRHAPFQIITDHRPLLSWRKTDSDKDPTGRRTRWALELDCYEFELTYKKGKTHGDADAMSRRGDDDDEIAVDTDDFFGLSFVEGVPDKPTDDFFYFLGMKEMDEHSVAKWNIEEPERKRLKKEQNADQIISEVKSYVKKRKRLPRNFPSTWFKRNNAWLVLKDGILYRRSYSETVHSNVLQAIIPDSMIEEVLSDLHGSNWSGHPSVGKMFLKAHRYVAWPSLAGDIKKKVRECAVCDQLREQVPKPQTPLQPIVATKVFEHVMCDLISFPTPSFGFKHVLVFKDVYSGYIRCYKLRDKTTKGVVSAFEDLVCLAGPPRVLSSDNGGEFVSGSLIEACRQLGVEKRTSVPYRPQTQGNVERQNRVLIKDLQHRLVQYGKSWSEHLRYVEWIYNTTPFTKTGMSPYFLFFNREPYLPAYAEPLDPKIVDATTEIFRRELEKRVKAVHEEANRRADCQRKKEKEAYDRGVKHVPFRSGDRVWEKVHVRTKLDPKWSGPITVRERRSSPGREGTTYVCERRDGSVCHRNYEQLKRVNAKYNEIMKIPLPVDERKQKEPPFSSFIASLGFHRSDTLTPPTPAPTVTTPPTVTKPISQTITNVTLTVANASMGTNTTTVTGSKTTTVPTSVPTTTPNHNTISQTPTTNAGEPVTSPATLVTENILLPTITVATTAPTSVNTTPTVSNTHSSTMTQGEMTTSPEGEHFIITKTPTQKSKTVTLTENTETATTSQITLTETTDSHLTQASVSGPSQDKNTSRINDTGSTIESTTELDLGFLESSPVSEEVRAMFQQTTTPKVPDVASGPAVTKPPPHPLLSRNEDSPLFYTPSANLETSLSPLEGIQSPDNSPNENRYRSKSVCRKLVLEPDQNDPILLSGEESDPETPTLQSCTALEVFSDQASGYLVNSPSGRVAVDRITLNEPQTNDDTIVDQPSTSANLRNLRTKIQDKGNKARSLSSSAVYPQYRVNQANTARERNLTQSTSQENIHKPQNLRPRQANGRFAKKTNTDK